jgi:hypothetical protein
MKKIQIRDIHFGSATLLSVVAGCSCNLHPVAFTPSTRHSPKTLEEGDIRERGCQTENPQSVRTAKTSSEHGVNKNSNKTFLAVSLPKENLFKGTVRPDWI